MYAHVDDILGRNLKTLIKYFNTVIVRKYFNNLYTLKKVCKNF